MKTKDLQAKLELSKLQKKCDKALEKADTWKALCKDSEKSTKLAKSEAVKAKRELETLMGLKKKTKALKVKAPKKNSKSESVVVMQSSDWHIAETITQESVRGLNEFNLDICDERIEKLYQKTLELTNIERGSTKIESLVWHWGGDLVNGVLREEDLEQNSLSPIEEGIWLKQRLKKGIEYFLAKGDFAKIFIPCSPGNHGRLTPKLRISTEHQNSIEYMVYCLLEDEYKDEKRVEFENPKSTFTWVDVFEKYPCRFHHGTFIKGGGGGIGGIYPSLFKYIHRQNQTQKAFMDYLGHLHRYTPGENFLINPCLVGYNSYAQACGFAFEPPAQAISFIEKDLGITGMRKVYL